MVTSNPVTVSTATREATLLDVRMVSERPLAYHGAPRAFNSVNPLQDRALTV
jgi:hypothetical protein